MTAGEIRAALHNVADNQVVIILDTWSGGEYGIDDISIREEHVVMEAAIIQ